jgi:uncharacterized protein (DUF2252 family)
MDIDVIEATSAYERWLGRIIPLVRADLVEKHRRMRLGPFPFMRATFYRWCQRWDDGAPDLARATRVLAVGDLHVENFGTWRDSEGRLIWGINDFDEATTLPWTQDLVRLAVSANLAASGDHLRIGRRLASDAILEGYRDGIASGGCAFVLEEENGWLRRIAMAELRDPRVFWRKLNALPTARRIDRAAAAAIDAAMPARGLAPRHARRVAGIGSLGRPRFVGLARWGGGLVAREAKRMAPSARDWATSSPARPVPYQEIIERAVRVVDPTIHVAGHWLVRRLAPHCSRIELADLPDARNEERLLYAMGFETANVHLGTRGAARAVGRELHGRPGRWLHEIADEMAAETTRDWKQWRG